jgi:hypothetical protein
LPLCVCWWASLIGTYSIRSIGIVAIAIAAIPIARPSIPRAPSAVTPGWWTGRNAGTGTKLAEPYFRSLQAEHVGDVQPFELRLHLIVRQGQQPLALISIEFFGEEFL